MPVTSNTHHTDDELQNEFYEIKNIATTELKKAANKVKDVNNQDNLGELWKNIQRIKRRNIIADIFIILTNPKMNQDGKNFDNIVELLITYIDIIVVLIRRETLVLAASVIASEASRIALCIAIVTRFSSNNNNNANSDANKMKINQAIDNIAIVLRRLNASSPSKVPTNGLFIEIMFLKQVFTFLKASSSSNNADLYKASGKIANGVFKLVIGTATGGAGGNPLSGIGNVLQGGADLVKAGIKHRLELKEKMIFFTVLTIKTEASNIIQTMMSKFQEDKEVTHNIYNELENKLVMLYNTAFNLFGTLKLNPPVVIVLAFVQLLGSLLMYVLEHSSEIPDVTLHFQEIIDLLWNGNERKRLNGLKYFITYDPTSDIVSNVQSKGKMYVGVVDDILKSHETMMMNVNPTIMLLHKLINGGQYLIDQAVQEGKERMKHYVNTIIPTEEEEAFGVIFDEIKRLVNEYDKNLNGNEVELKINFINKFVGEGKTKLLNMISTFEKVTAKMLRDTQSAIIHVKEFQSSILKPIADELNTIKSVCSSMLSNFVDGELKDLFDDINKAIVDAHRIIQEITLIVDECNVAVEKLQTCVLTSRELVISPEGSDVSLYKFMQLLKKIPSPTGSTALADLVFERLKVIVNSKLEAEDETKVDDAIDKRIKRIYDEIKNVTNKMESFGIEQFSLNLIVK